ncbi:hypothetical protein M405DRAFT_286863 [Rhizopogon salebrosus TDB-379]|nr:hypothetical protein M405DRAFT_286863 [Rhizopogon salebrosus TDB-379]
MYLRSCPHAPLIHCSKQLYEYLYQNGLPFDVELSSLPFSYATHFHLVMLELVFGARTGNPRKSFLAGDHAFRTVIGRQNHTRKCDSLFPQESTGNVLFWNEIPPRRHSATRCFERSALTSPPTQLRPPMPQQACISLPTNADLMDVDPGPQQCH